MITAFQVRLGAIYARIKPTRKPAYLQWIKRFPCVGCGTTRMVDPSHTGRHGYGQRADDLDALPMCRTCHIEFGANPRKFALVWQLDIAERVAFFRHLWQLKMARSAQ